MKDKEIKWYISSTLCIKKYDREMGERLHPLLSQERWPQNHKEL